jgi:hypothetical protein
VFLLLGAFVLVRGEGRGLSPRAWTAVGILWVLLGLVQVGLGIAA